MTGWVTDNGYYLAVARQQESYAAMLEENKRKLETGLWFWDPFFIEAPRSYYEYLR